MFYYSKKSSKKIIHSFECFRIRNTDLDSIGWFETLDEAYDAGYRLCRNCSVIAKQYRKERRDLIEYCRHNAVSFFFHDKFIGIYTPYSKWKIVPSADNKKLVLYHKNSFEGSATIESPILGYHLQSVRKNTVMGYIRYVASHEFYRMHNPLYIKPQNVMAPPRKGTKRYKKQQLEEKRISRRQSVQTVLKLIDDLQSQQRPAM